MHTPKRKRLPATRASITHSVHIGEGENSRQFLITMGLFDNGQAGEIFITSEHTGTTEDGLCDAWATQVSLCLQYGVPEKVIYDLSAYQGFPPNGKTDNADIPLCRSIIDYTLRWMQKVDLEARRCAIQTCKATKGAGSHVIPPGPDDGLQAGLDAIE